MSRLHNQNFAKFALYGMLAQITGKEHNTVKIWFFRNKRDITKAEDFLFYIAKYNEPKGKN